MSKDKLNEVKSNEVIEYIRKQPGINEIVLNNKIKQNHIRQNHTESNPLYEAILEDALGTIKNVLMTLECSKVHNKDWHVWRAYRTLERLKDRLTEGV